MKKYTRYFLLSVMVLTLYSTAFSQKGKEWEKYKYRTLTEITMINRETTDNILRQTKLEEKTDFIGSDLFYSRARVRFTGNLRPISPDHRDLIKTWAKLQNVDSKMINLYENEILFKDCDKEYWIPVPIKPGEAMTKELKPNEMLTLFVVHIGGRKAQMANDYDWLFLTTGFEK